MTLSIESQSSPWEGSEAQFSELVQQLSAAGYEPLITGAKERIAEIFGVPPDAMASRREIDEELYYNFAIRRRVMLRYSDDFGLPLSADLFFSEHERSLIYIALFSQDSQERPRRASKSHPQQIEIGIIGMNLSDEALSPVIEAVSSAMVHMEFEPNWSPIRPRSPQFLDLSTSEEGRFLSASDLSQIEIAAAELLEDPDTRDMALVVKRAGGILASDITKRSKANPEDAIKIVQTLTEAELIKQEYVVICQKRANQVNRVDSYDMFQKMSELGVLCSCGNPIADERIEELFTPTDKLQYMLDQSLWMTARLVHYFSDLRVPQDALLLNLHEGAEEIDAFVDLEGTLFMFELKDSEFSMGHAYPFGGRIGLYKPDYAIIVSTKGVAPEVREYFNRVKPGAELVYVDNISELRNTLRNLVTQVRTNRAYEKISVFEPLMSLNIPLDQVISARLGIQMQRTRRRARG